MISEVFVPIIAALFLAMVIFEQYGAYNGCFLIIVGFCTIMSKQYSWVIWNIPCMYIGIAILTIFVLKQIKPSENVKSTNK